MVGRGRTVLSALSQYFGLRPSGSILLTGMCGLADGSSQGCVSHPPSGPGSFWKSGKGWVQLYGGAVGSLTMPMVCFCDAVFH